ncbi:hypothetical protein M758_2G004100 [Ceratodon purpureus]|uniref:Uncharacterized protein n=1 Tax=Ceratodon purpureus TaxID=3225 RepID=A0A8T0IQN0_CERPU|nr:hypothetical protein KC19_2G004300 [Ceratodon purpureus]KAG0624790.1 hypothetical protein M758_2G004100 [Ceratodon purpureus]
MGKEATRISRPWADYSSLRLNLEGPRQAGFNWPRRAWITWRAWRRTAGRWRTWRTRTLTLAVPREI